MSSIETPRVLMRPFSAADVEAAFVWFGDPVVMKFARGPDRSIDTTEERVARYMKHQDEHGFSKWIVIDKQSGAAIGDAGLLIQAETGRAPDLGFRLLPSFWGRGLASEIADGWCRAAFDRFGLTALSAFAHVDNVASLRVLEKVGFERQDRRFVMGMDAYTYARNSSPAGSPNWRTP